ncbi:UNVERIFIED_CONTAM: hypothetical protein Scaly_0324600 [Sesamum calycinum]|uniref:Uncharacterized protein n=1 Tax=Sesamum calycinum TaxID=2727403 RepID=A0AAW2SAT5_9LAMI
MRMRVVDSHPFFYLEDLWESFSEWSVHAVYIDPLKPSSRVRGPTEEGDAELYRLTTTPDRISLGDKSVISSATSEADHANSPGLPLFQFLEHEQPYNRRPLADKISLLSSQCPELSKFKSCDLLPTSFLCSLYPIYRIPIGPTLQDLDASFLTFHSLSTQSRGDRPPQFHAANTRTVRGVTDPTPKISLPVFALASYKLKGSIVSPCGPHECDAEKLSSASRGIGLDVCRLFLPDYQFFRVNYSHRR